jgi:hypothetical protein
VPPYTPKHEEASSVCSSCRSFPVPTGNNLFLVRSGYTGRSPPRNEKRKKSRRKRSILVLPKRDEVQHMGIRRPEFRPAYF